MLYNVIIPYSNFTAQEVLQSGVGERNRKNFEAHHLKTKIKR